MDVIKLDKICTIRSGGTPSRSKKEFYGGNIPWAKISDLEKSGDGFVSDTEEKITQEGLEAINNKIFEKGTLLFAMYGSVGKIAIANTRLSCNQAILGINPRSSNDLDLSYLKYWFAAKKEELINSARGVALKNLSATIIKNLEIPLPPLKIQQKIAAILDKADRLVQLNRQLLEKYGQLAQSLFLEMFGDPYINSKGWLKSKTIDFCNCIVPGRDKPKSFSGEIPWVTTADLKHLSITYDSKEKIGLTRSEIQEVKAKIIPRDSVIMTCVGDLGVVSINTKEIVINQQLHAFQCGNEINNVFLMYNLFFQRPYMEKMASKTTVSYMNKSIANSTPSIVPPIELQNLFANKVRNLESQKSLAQQSLQKSQDLFQSLLQKAFKGERIKEEVKSYDLENK